MKIDGFLPQQLLQIVGKTAPEVLTTGDTLQGRVVAVENGLLFLKLLDGSSFTARVPEGFSAQQGALLTLQIGERVEDQLTARIIQPETQADNISDEANPDRAAISKSLSLLGARPTEALITKALDIMEKAGGLDAEKASFLAANDIQPDKEMISLLMRLAQKEYRIDENLSLLRDNILNSMVENPGGELENTLVKPLIQHQELEKLAESLVDDLLGELPPDDRPKLDQQTRLQLTKNLVDDLERQLASGEHVTRDALEAALHKVLSNLQKALPQGGSDSLKPMSDPLSENVTKGWIDRAQDELAAMQDKLGDARRLEPAEIKKALESVFEKAYVKAENGEAEPVALHERIKAMKEIMTLAEKAVTQMDAKSHEANLPIIRELQNAMQFFNQVTTYHTFVQIPLMFNQQNTTGELYIMRDRKKRGRIDPNKFTLFISLNTRHLGLIETFLNATNHYVTINFRVASEELVKLVKDNHRVLYDALKAKGYKLAELRCRVHDDQPVNLFNALEKTEDALGLNTRLDLKI